ncbi:MAG: GNAT family N-acetyltransferase, partial [Caulobacteraceae bacterium]|nr:GNAT family N-acetyltransferase [Caulobacter sp.]
DEGGLLLACIHVEAEGEIARFGMFAVDPVRQAVGVGRAVLQGAEAHAIGAWNASEMRLLVIAARSELIAWYERRDYRLTGATAPFPYGDTRFGLPRQDDLRFIEMAKPLSTRA